MKKFYKDYLLISQTPFQLTSSQWFTCALSTQKKGHFAHSPLSRKRMDASIEAQEEPQEASLKGESGEELACDNKNTTSEDVNTRYDDICAYTSEG